MRVVTTLTLLLLLAAGPGASRVRGDDRGPREPQSRDTIQAIARIPDPFVRMSALEKFYQRQRRKVGAGEVDRNLLLHLTDTAYQVRNFTAVLRYGEEGLRRDWNNPRLKMALLFTVARAAEELGVNTQKALQYVDVIVALARAADPGHGDPLVWERFVAPALRLSMRLRAAHAAGDAAAWKRALDAGIAALKLQATEDSGRELYDTALQAYNDGHGAAAAVAALEALCGSSLARTEYINRLAFWYSRAERREEAADLLIGSYRRKRDPAVAYTIGKLLQNSRSDQAMDFLAEAVQAGNDDVAVRARRLLEHLFFNVHAADMAPGEREAAFDRLMKAAARRLARGDEPADKDPAGTGPAPHRDS